MVAPLDMATDLVSPTPPAPSNDWRIVPRLIKAMQALIKGILSVVALGTSAFEVFCNPRVSTWMLFAYEVASFFFPWMFRSLTFTRFTWLDVISSLVSLLMMLF